MPIDRHISPERVGFDDSLTSQDIAELARDPHVRVVQTHNPVGSKTWRQLNDLLFGIRPDVQLRVYGFYSQACDLSFLCALSNVQHFSADCLRSAQNIEAITQMPALRSLGIGILDLHDFEFLADLSNALEEIYLGATLSKRPSLRHLERFTRLKKLSIDGHRKNLDTISDLATLEDLTLRSVTVKDLSFVRPLSKLWSLDIKLGGSNDLSALHDIGNIKYLELWQIRGLSDLSPISSLTGLQFLFLQSLPQVTALPDFSRLIKLRRVHLDNMKGIRDLNPLCRAPALEEVQHVNANTQRPQDYVELLKSKTVRRLAVGFGSNAKNQAFSALLAEYNKAPFKYSPFAFSD